MFGSRQASDEQIIYKIRQGDEKMLMLLYKRNYDTVKSYILRNKGAIADAEDMLQEALVVLWQNVQSETFSLSAKLDTYIYAVVKNLWLKQLRKTGRMSATDFSEDKEQLLYEESSGEEEQDDRVQALVKYMQQLSGICRELLSLFYFEQWDMEQIAHKLQLANAQTAKAKKYQCKKKLEELIRQHFKADDLL